MYPDTKRLKDNKITIRLDDYEHRLVMALADYQGEQPSTLMRRIVMRAAVELLTDDTSVSPLAG
jgi:uncharacterized protein (DUF1778 family)